MMIELINNWFGNFFKIAKIHNPSNFRVDASLNVQSELHTMTMSRRTCVLPEREAEDVRLQD